MSKKYDTLVFIGRFQPVHNAHAEIIYRAAKLAKQIVVIVGSAKQPRTYKNPWTANERMLMLQNVCDEMDLPPDVNIRFESNIDTIYNDQAWAARVQSIVRKHTQLGDNVGIIGHVKDDSSFYLNMFPQWKLEQVELIEPLHASNIRDLYFRRDVNTNFLCSVIPPSVLRMLVGWAGTPDHEQVIKEREFLVEHNKQYAGLKYPPIFVTADAVVIQSGHALMVKRRAEPGRGLWAWPGGYVNAYTDKSIVDAMLRELREETGIKVPMPVLRGSIVDCKVFDAVDRSPRGRIITHAYKIVLPDGSLPLVKGRDDAIKAKFRELSEIRSEECFEDHYEIKQWAVGE